MRLEGALLPQTALTFQSRSKSFCVETTITKPCGLDVMQCLNLWALSDHQMGASHCASPRLPHCTLPLTLNPPACGPVCTLTCLTSHVRTFLPLSALTQRNPLLACDNSRGGWTLHDPLNDARALTFLLTTARVQLSVNCYISIDVPTSTLSMDYIVISTYVGGSSDANNCYCILHALAFRPHSYSPCGQRD